MMMPEIPVDAILRPGSEMIVAGYAMYGSFTSLVISTGNGVDGYTLDPVNIKIIFSLFWLIDF